MAGSIRKLIIIMLQGLLVACIAFCALSSKSMAAGESGLQFVPVQDGYYALAGTESQDVDTSYRLGLAQIDAVYKEAGGLSYIDVKFLKKNGIYTMVLSAADVKTLQSMHAQTESWLALNMKNIVPQGTSKSVAIKLTADWVADRMTYDHRSMIDRNTLISYQNAMSCFTTGKGVCTTYATAFDSMISYLPINPTTGCVDYTCIAPMHIPTMLVTNDVHAWSAIQEADGWHLYDVCYYDNDNKAKQKQYLNMSKATASDGYHSNIQTSIKGIVYSK